MNLVALFTYGVMVQFTKKSKLVRHLHSVPGWQRKLCLIQLLLWTHYKERELFSVEPWPL